MKRIPYTQLTLRRCETLGWLPAKAEYYQHFHAGKSASPSDPTKKIFGVRRDLFGFVDIVALDVANRRVVFIQSTSAAQVSAHLAKMRPLASVRAALRCGVAVECWGWQKIDGRWQPRRVALTLAELAGVEVESLPRKVRRRERELF